MYMYMYTCMYICIYVFMYACTHVCTCMYIYINIYTRTYIYHMYADGFVRICEQALVHVCLVYLCTYFLFVYFQVRCTSSCLHNRSYNPLTRPLSRVSQNWLLSRVVAQLYEPWTSEYGGVEEFPGGRVGTLSSRTFGIVGVVGASYRVWTWQSGPPRLAAGCSQAIVASTWAPDRVFQAGAGMIFLMLAFCGPCFWPRILSNS